MSLDEQLVSSPNNQRVMEELYEQFQKDPTSVDPSWQKVFSSLSSNGPVPSITLPAPSLKPLPPVAPVPTLPVEGAADIRIFNLINAYRSHGHLLSRVNPLAATHKEPPASLGIETWGFTKHDLQEKFPTCGLLEKSEAKLEDIIEALRVIYCSNIGVEYLDTVGPKMESWLQEQIEPNGFTRSLAIEQKQLILQHLNKSELFESFLQTKYVGQKRFSLEGGETLIPILASIVEKGADHGIQDFIIGMAHRGRLNVLTNILDKSYADVFSEFEDHYIPESFEGSGDVKYHKGFTSSILTSSGHRVNVRLPPNPSHLESVAPVVEGQVRSLQEKAGRFDQALPILIHGDAALSGQGVVYETMQLGRLKGYGTGGTVHIVINNQIGFTTLPTDGRSTHYCTDVARAFRSPVFHVNAEDPEACVYATLLALEIRQKFNCDVFVDLICYRKYGHNESDEPAFTQPLEYQVIRKKKPIREIYRDDLIQQGHLEKYVAEQLEEEFKKSLQLALTGTKEKKHISPPEIKKMIWHPEKIETAVSYSLIKKVGERICTVPEDFHIHKKLQSLLNSRWEMVEQESGGRPVDWGMAEHLAFGTLLMEGHHLRLSGQDCLRGTFSHRHAVWKEQEEENEYAPLANLKPDQGKFSIYNSPLSEYAVLGFEFGYSMAWPEALVIWEAQFGDFANGAQIIIDQYISTAEQKWGAKVNLTLFLPHGYEGQGPEHSSARIERFLALCGDGNMQVVNPTTPAQLFHLLRRQTLHKSAKPLLVMTPKGLLRHPKCISLLQDFTKGEFQETLIDPEAPKKPKRIAFCSGRIYYDLIQEKEKRRDKDLTILRIEQLYPFPRKEIEAIIASSQEVKEYLWVQEEPKNMGPYHFVYPYLQKRLPKGKKLIYVGRARSASPAVGSFALHKKEHAALISKVFPFKEENEDLNIHHLQRV